jgi:SulP family sulfate permease
VAVGVLAAVILFVHNYSRVSVVTHTLSAADHPSNVDRPPGHRRLLAERGSQVLVLRLQGFLFFGTANTVLHQVRARAEQAGERPLRFVVLDFHRVSGLDSSASFSLSRALQLAEKHGFQLILTHLNPEIRRQLREDVFRADAGALHRLLPTLDHGMEWCEEQLLGEAPETESREVPSLREQLAPFWSAPRDLDAFLGRLERLELSAGERLIRQGEPADALYFVESGEVTTALVTAGGERRLRRQGPGTVLGELGLILELPRTASVIADTPCVVYRLAGEDLDRMRRESPEWAAQFYAFLVRHLAERVVNCNRIIKAFME